MSLAVPFVTWSSNVADKKRVELILSKILVRMQLLCLARPWQAWMERTDERKRLKRAAKLVLKRWQGKETAPAFETWRSEYASTKGNAIRPTRLWFAGAACQ